MCVCMCAMDDILNGCICNHRIRDFLLGIRVKGLDDEDAGLGDTTGLTDAERLRVVYEILTGPESDGGANVSPNLDPYVESIMALHDDRFDKVKERISDYDLVLRYLLSKEMDTQLVT